MHADALLCSHPRSGGRWLRYLVAHALASLHGVDVTVTPGTVFSLVPDHHDDPARGYPALALREHLGCPVAAACHQPYSWEFHQGYPVVFLARNPYDVVVSGYAHLARQRGEYGGSMREFIRHPALGLASWIHHVNSWAPVLLTHRDATFLAYGELDGDTPAALARVLDFLGQPPDPGAIHAAVASGDALRRGNGIRTGQEGTFWDHLQPDEIFDVQEMCDRGLSEGSLYLLAEMGVEVDPFPRGDL